ncbi:MAG: glucose-6-phosphate isomerase [Culicoidibacterales bacterium]
MSITLNNKFLSNSLNDGELDNLGNFIPTIHQMLHHKTGQGSNFLGWLSLPEDYDKAEFSRMKIAASKINEIADILVVIGIGGSYLGARSVIEAASHSFYNDINKTRIIFAGHQMSGTYLNDLVQLLENKSWAINVISKSGTTTEPALAFRVLKALLEKKHGKEGARSRIFATTDKAAGALKQVAVEEGYETFIIPDDVGGRFSVLTPVGILPIAVAGVDVDALMKGAYAAMKKYNNDDYQTNDAYKYALMRNCLYNKGKTIEMFASYEPNLQYFGEWWKQLFGESEGKNQKGIFPTSAQFSTDLHSLGQYIQDGRKDMFETIISIKKPQKDILIELDAQDLDGLNFIAGKSLNYANSMAMNGTILAHSDGNIPNILLEIETLDAFNIGSLIYFFELACATSGYLLGVNPFDQEGVEAYKKNMFALLGKPGFEELKSQLEQRLNNK